MQSPLSANHDRYGCSLGGKASDGVFAEDCELIPDGFPHFLQLSILLRWEHGKRTMDVRYLPRRRQ